MSDTQSAEREAELSRRLGDIASTTTVDAEAWEKIQSHLATTKSRSRPSTPWQLAAVAAVLVLVGAVVMARRDDGQNVDTSDDTTTTLERTTSTTDRDPTTTSTTEAPPTVTPPADGTGPGDSSGTPGTGTAPPGGSGETVPGPTAPTGPPVYGADGRAAVANWPMSNYVMSLTAWRDVEGDFGANLWYHESYTYRYEAGWNWPDVPGQNCLMGLTRTAGFGYASGHVFSFGLVSSDAEYVRVVNRYGEAVWIGVGEEVAPGVRAWLGESPPGEVDHYEALGPGGSPLLSSAPRDSRASVC